MILYSDRPLGSGRPSLANQCQLTGSRGIPWLQHWGSVGSGSVWAWAHQTVFKHFEWGGSENKQRRYVEINVWMSTHVRLFAHTRAHMCVHERDGESERGKEFFIFFFKCGRFCNTPSSHTPGCQDERGGICLMYSIYSLHTRCCTTASSVAWDTPLPGRVAINQPEWGVSRTARKLKLVLNQHLRLWKSHPASSQ